METLAAALSLFLTLFLTTAPMIEADTVDCSPILLKLADCLDYVYDGSTIETPLASCCSGLKDVLKKSPDCLCVGFQSSAQFGVKLNIAKAFGLPRACNLFPPPTVCTLAPAPLIAPPSISPESPSPPATEVNVPTPSTDPGNVAITPASMPRSAAFSSTSLATTAFALLFAFFC